MRACPCTLSRRLMRWSRPGGAPPRSLLSAAGRCLARRLPLAANLAAEQLCWPALELFQADVTSVCAPRRAYCPGGCRANCSPVHAAVRPGFDSVLSPRAWGMVWGTCASPLLRSSKPAGVEEAQRLVGDDGRPRRAGPLAPPGVRHLPWRPLQHQLPGGRVRALR